MSSFPQPNNNTTTQSQPQQPPPRLVPASSPQEAQRLQQLFNQHTGRFPVTLEFPSIITNQTQDKPLRTNTDLIQVRLLEAGVTYEQKQTLSYAAERLADFVASLEQSGCFDSVQAELDTRNADDNNENGSDSDATHRLHVKLQEKKWYRLYVGGGLRNDLQGEFLSGSNTAVLAKTAQFEVSGGLTNVTGNLDLTTLQYTVDALQQSKWELQHSRPLDSLPGLLPTLASNFTDQLGNYTMSWQGRLDTLDYEWTRSYRERQRCVSLKCSNQGQAPVAEAAPTPYVGWKWEWLFRDIIPRRHATQPYALDASSAILQQSGPSEKQSLHYEYRTNGTLTDDKFQPTEGLDHYTQLEVAGPPGDVGFVKAQAGGAFHWPLLWLSSNNSSVTTSPLLALHASFHTGMLHNLSFGGACRPATISDRFFVGGPMQLRGFGPAGIGPRAAKHTSSKEPGDALGGEFFYTATLATSITTAALDAYNIRLLGFANAGTLVGSLTTAPSMTTVAKSSRLAVGVGASVGLPMGRVEATYAWPIRYGPRDIRKHVQFGIGFSFG